MYTETTRNQKIKVRIFKIRLITESLKQNKNPLIQSFVQIGVVVYSALRQGVDYID